MGSGCVDNDVVMSNTEHVNTAAGNTKPVRNVTKATGSNIVVNTRNTVDVRNEPVSMQVPDRAQAESMLQDNVSAGCFRDALKTE